MNYIHSLEIQCAAVEEQIMDAKDFVRYLKSYLQSSKFSEDTTVQVQDVLSRLLPVEECLSDVYYDMKKEKYVKMKSS